MAKKITKKRIRRIEAQIMIHGQQLDDHMTLLERIRQGGYSQKLRDLITQEKDLRTAEDEALSRVITADAERHNKIHEQIYARLGKFNDDAAEKYHEANRRINANIDDLRQYWRGHMEALVARVDTFSGRLDTIDDRFDRFAADLQESYDARFAEHRRVIEGLSTKLTEFMFPVDPVTEDAEPDRDPTLQLGALKPVIIPGYNDESEVDYNLQTAEPEPPVYYDVEPT